MGGRCPSCLLVRGGVHPRWVSSSLVGQHGLSPSCMALGWCACSYPRDGKNMHTVHRNREPSSCEETAAPPCCVFDVPKNIIKQQCQAWVVNVARKEVDMYKNRTVTCWVWEVLSIQWISRTAIQRHPWSPSSCSPGETAALVKSSPHWEWAWSAVGDVNQDLTPKMQTFHGRSEQAELDSPHQYLDRDLPREAEECGDHGFISSFVNWTTWRNF